MHKYAVIFHYENKYINDVITRYIYAPNDILALETADMILRDLLNDNLAIERDIDIIKLIE